MIHWFNYKGKSSDNFGIYIQEKSVFSVPAKDVTYQSVPGRNGDIIIDNGRHKNLELPYKVAIISKSRFLYNVDDIKNWLIPDTNYYKLYDSYDLEHYRLATVTQSIPIDQVLRKYGTATLTFNCKPFRYSFVGDNTITLTESDSVIKNREQYNSLPYLRIVGNGDIILYINNIALYLYDVDEYVEIDSDMMNCFKGTINLNNKMQSDGFPVFDVGKNIISWTGNVEKVEIKPRWRTI